MSDDDPFVIALQQWIEISMDRSIRNYICYARETGLSMSQLGALFYIHRAGSSGVGDLGEHLGVTSAAASQMLDRLEQQELILCLEDPSDRRAKQISLTAKGLDALRQSTRARQVWLYELAAILSDSEKEPIAKALTTLIDKAGHLGQPVEVAGNLLQEEHS